MEKDARETLRGWEERRAKEELDEKRRVAPGWLDSGVHLLRPENIGEELQEQTEQAQEHAKPQGSSGAPSAVGPIGGSREAEELDRAFGGLNVK